MARPAKQLRICAQCGKKEWLSPSRAVRRFCSRTCWLAAPQHPNSVRTHFPRRHGMKGTVVYRRWFHMRERVKAKPNYAGRVTVCDRWQTFENFYADMGEPPTPQHTIDRIDNNGNYEPGNCRWATPREQAANRRNNVWLEANGERYITAEWARRLGVPPPTIWGRLKAGWDVTRAVTTPTKRSAVLGQTV